ncbi:MAG: hypothetical protein Q7J77_12815 [Undibacterium sp.]|nr:hypothetical protein [Undibacterium sp.]
MTQVQSKAARNGKSRVNLRRKKKRTSDMKRAFILPADVAPAVALDF